MRLALLSLLVVAGFGAVAASCGAPARCSPELCPSGCCSALGQCLPGSATDACGASGQACVDCGASGQACTAQACVAAAFDAGTTPGGGADAGAPEFCLRNPVACSDQAIAGLDLLMPLATGGIVNTADGAGWKSTIDTRGGGYPPSLSYVYARFTATGLDLLPLDDLTALDSMDWDIAFRRFVIRINSGDSGPACVTAAMLPTGTTYAAVTALPTGLVFESDDFLTDAPACAFVDDGSGLTTSPRTYLSTFYRYASCVRMTGQVFVLRAGNGRHVKLVVDTYYSTEAQQAACDTGGMPGTSGTLRLRWAFLD